MAKVHGVAVISTPAHGTHEVRVTSSKASAAGEAGATHHAPGWRAMAFRSPEKAMAKLESHPGFKGWKERSAAQKEASRENGKAHKGPRDT